MLDKREELILYLETTSPEILLTDIARGVPPSKQDLLIIQSIRDTSRLPDPVINVLLQYVLLKTDMKLTKSLSEKISAHWARKQIKTAAEALDLAKKEHTSAGNKILKNVHERFWLTAILLTTRLPTWYVCTILTKTKTTLLADWRHLATSLA